MRLEVETLGIYCRYFLLNEDGEVVCTDVIDRDELKIVIENLKAKYQFVINLQPEGDF